MIWREYKWFETNSSPTRELVAEVRDPDGVPAATLYTYYDTYGMSRRRLQSVRRPDGSWVAYTYHTSGPGSGMIHCIAEPWLDGPANPPSSFGPTWSDGKLTVLEYENGEPSGYTGDPVSRQRRVSERKVFVGDRLVEHVKHEYEATTDTWLDAIQITTKRAPGPVGSWNDVPSEIVVRVDAEVEGIDTPELTDFVFSQKQADGRKVVRHGEPVLWQHSQVSPVYNTGMQPVIIEMELVGVAESGFAASTPDEVDLSTDIDFKDGSTLVRTWAGFTPVWLVPYSSTAEVTIRHWSGVLLRESYIYIGDHTFQRVSWEETDNWPMGPLSRINHLGQEWTWKYEMGTKTTETHPDGTEVVHLLDAKQRKESTIVSGRTAPGVPGGSGAPWTLQDLPTVTTSFTYNGNDRLTSETTSGGGAESLSRSWTYDQAGRIEEETAICGRVITYELGSTLSGSIGGIDIDWLNQRTVTDQSSGLLTVETAYRDGRLKSVTGTAAQPRRWEWDLVADGGSSWSFVRSTEYLVEAVAVNPDEHAVLVRQFNGRGQPMVEQTPSAAAGGDWITRIFQYYTPRAVLHVEHLYAPDLPPGAVIMHYPDALGMQSTRVVRSGPSTTLDLDGDDRVTVTYNRFVHDGSHWWFREQVAGMVDEESAALTVLSRTDHRLTGFSSGLISESRHYGAHASVPWTSTLPTLESEERVWFSKTTGLTTTETSGPGMTSGVWTRGRIGRVEHITDATGSVELRDFDELGRHTATRRWDRPSSHPGIFQRTENEYALSKTHVVETRRLTGWNDTTPMEDIIRFTYDQCARLTRIDRVVEDGDPEADPVVPDTVVSTRFGYDERGRRTQRWGSAVEPEERVYDGFGRLAELRTFRDGTDTVWNHDEWPTSGVTADSVTWQRHDPTGLVIAEKDAAENETIHEYDGFNRPVLRETATGRRRITEYVPFLGDVKKIRYETAPSTADPDTPTVEFTYDRMGRATTVKDAFGTRTFAYDPTGDRRLLHEQLPAGYGESGYGPRRITHRYNAQRRWNGYQLGDATDPYLDADVTYTWSSVNGRLNGVTSELDPGFGAGGASRTWTYEYELGGRMPSFVETGSGSSHFRINTARSPYRPEQVTGVANEYDSTSIATYGYDWDRRGRLEKAYQAGTMFEELYGTQGLKISYGYDTRDRLTSAETQWHNGSTWATVADREFTAEYDFAGNRTESTRYTTGTGGTQDHTPNELNQITEFENVPRALITGAASTSVDIKVRKGGSTTPAARAHKYFYYGFQDVRSTDGYAAVEVHATVDSEEEADVYEANVPVRRHEEARAFDDDGNPTTSGALVHKYDGENRLVEVQRGSYTRVRHTYDWQGRRARTQIIFGTDPEEPAEVRTFEFVYLGGRLISQVITNTGGEESEYEHEDTQELYLWGLDRSGTLEGAGTIGGLLAMVRGWGEDELEELEGWEVPSYVAQDGLGNIVAYISPSGGQRQAEFEYGPFGETLRTTAAGYGDGAAWGIHRFAHRWQNKFSSAFFSTIDLPMAEYYDFGLRWYEPSLGRFLNRDPIGTAGGSNVYAFVGNNPFGGWDAWGLEPISGTLGGLTNHSSRNGWYRLPNGDIEYGYYSIGIDNNSGSVTSIQFYVYDAPSPEDYDTGNEVDEGGDSGPDSDTESSGLADCLRAAWETYQNSIERINHLFNQRVEAYVGRLESEAVTANMDLAIAGAQLVYDAAFTTAVALTAKQHLTRGLIRTSRSIHNLYRVATTEGSIQVLSGMASRAESLARGRSAMISISVVGYGIAQSIRNAYQSHDLEASSAGILGALAAPVLGENAGAAISLSPSVATQIYALAERGKSIGDYLHNQISGIQSSVERVGSRFQTEINSCYRLHGK